MQMPQLPRSRGWNLAVTLLLAGLVLALDLSIPLGVAGGVPYVAVVLLSLRSPDPRLPIRMAALCTLLTLTGLLLSPSGGVAWMVVANRLLAAFAIWVTAILGTRWQRASHEMAQQQQRVAEVSRMNTAGELASGIAHELNQPLASVLNYAEAASLAVRRGDLSAEKILKDLQSIADAAELGGQILRRLRNFITHRPTARSPQDVNTLVEDAMSLLSSEQKRLGVDTRIQLSTTLPRVLVDPILIQQVIVNLVRNAIEAMEGSETRRLLVRSSQHDSGEVEIAIEDSGKGPAKADIEVLFEHFVSSKPEGLGVGLAISRSIVEAHGGQLTAERNPHQGMTFRFTLSPIDAARGAQG